VVHRFGELDAKAEQRFAVGLGPRKFAFKRQHLSKRDRNSLITFWEGIQGAWQSFTYNAPNADQTTTATTVTWEYAPLSLQYLANACQTGFNFIEVPTAGPTYQVNSTCTRFPSSGLKTALLSQVQQIIPLIHIRVREAAVPDTLTSGSSNKSGRTCAAETHAAEGRPQYRCSAGRPAERERARAGIFRPAVASTGVPDTRLQALTDHYFLAFGK
jgi:hypothetical protein